MIGIALLFAIAAAGLAAACAAADGALLALDPDDGLEPPLADLQLRRERAHRALAFMRVVGQLGAGIGIALAVAAANGPAILAPLAALGGAVVVVGLAESVARSVGDTAGPGGTQRLLPFIRAVERLLAPIVAFGALVDRSLYALLPPREAGDEAREATAEQFRQIVAAEAEVTKDEQVLLTGVFRLAETEVHDLMVPRVDMVAIDRDTPWSEVVDRVRSSEHSRLPVFHENIDNIVGVLYAKDMLPAVLADDEPAGGWAALIRPAIFIPGAKKADDQLRDFQNSGTHIAIVVDEYGGTAGMVTIEDILEEIVGEILDEYDVEEAAIEQEEGRRFWVSARVTLSELSEILRHDFHRDNVSTVGGLVYELLGRVPKAGEELTIDGFRVVVERVARRRVRRVFFERLEVGAEHAA